jgi:hypothetical protein
MQPRKPRTMSRMSPSAPGARSAWWLALLVLAAFLLRAPALTRLLPTRPEPDPFSVLRAIDLCAASIDHDDSHYAQRYPEVFARLTAALPWPAPPEGRSPAEALPEHLRAASGPYLAGRWLALALSLLAVPGTWLATRRLAGERAAWVASALVSTALLVALFSTQARPHTAQVGVATLGVWLCMRLAERPSAARGLLATGACALATALLQTGAATLPALALAGWLGGGSAARRLGRAAGWTALAAGIAALAYPALPTWSAGALRLGGQGAHPIEWERTNFEGFFWLPRWLGWHDPVLLGLAALSLLAALLAPRASWRALGRPDARVACAHALPYYLLLTSLSTLHERFALPLVPWMAALAGALVARLAGPGAARFALATALAVALPLANCARFALISARSDTYELAADWIRGQPAARGQPLVASPGLVLPLPYERAALERAFEDPATPALHWLVHQRASPPSDLQRGGVPYQSLPSTLAYATEREVAAWVDALAPRHAVLERSLRNESLPGARALERLVEARGVLVWSSGPAGEERRALPHYQDVHGFAHLIWQAERLGAPVEVWRLAP